MSRIAICLLIIFGFQSRELVAQSGVNISTVPIPLDPSAILNVQSATQGVLLPKTTIGSITDPTDGLIVYDTILHNYMYFDVVQWTALLKASSFQFYYADRDGDGFGDKYGAIYATSQAMGYVTNSGDCNDLNGAISPNSLEICDSIDNNCDGLIDEGLDQDMDGFASCNGDCDDTNSSIHPGAVELCNGLDDDCDGLIDESCTPVNIDFVILQFPPSVFMLQGYTPAIYGRVFSVGVTEGIGQGAGILAQVGYGVNESDPSAGGWTWNTATFNMDQMNEDEYMGILTVATPGTYDYAYRFSADNGVTWTYADLSGSTNGYQIADAGDLRVVDDLCNELDDDGDGLIDESCPDLGQPCDGNDSDLCPEGIVVCLPNGDCGCNDDSNSSVEICNGIDDDCNGLIDDNCVVVSIQWGNVQFPPSISMPVGTTPEIYGRVFAMGITDSQGQGPGILAEVGYGADGSVPSAGGWTWVSASFNTDSGNDDEYHGSLTINTPGMYDYAYRYSGDGGVTWLYCDVGNGSADGYSPVDAGQMTVN